MSTITGIMTMIYLFVSLLSYVEEHVHDNRDYDDLFEPLDELVFSESKSMSTITGIMTG